MTDLDLRTGLAAIATEARPVDMYDRTLRRSRQIRRRRNAVASVAAMVAVLVVTGTTWRLLPGPGSAPMPPSGSPSPTAGPTDPATDEPTQPSTVLSNATLTFPDWPGPRDELGLGACPTGPITFIDNYYYDNATGTSLSVGDVVRVEAAGENHVVGVFSCGGPGQGSADQVLAYRAEGDGFGFVGSVVDTSVVTPAEGAWAFIGGLDGDVETVTVPLMLRLSIGTSVPQYEELLQQRTYGWDGSGYVQTAGPTSFLTGPAIDLSLTASDLVFGPAVEFCRMGQIALTVTNNGTEPVADVEVALVLPGLGETYPGDCQMESTGQGRESALVPVGELGPGQSRTVTARVVVDTRNAPAYDPSDPGPDQRRFEGSRPEAKYADLRVGDQRTGTTVVVTIQY